MNDSVFRQRVQSVMTDNMYERRVRGRTRGDLDMRSLYKVGAGSKNKNVFSQKMAKKGKMYNIVLAIDESGSMGRHGWGDYKIDKAAECARYLASQFIGLNINVAVIGYNGVITHHKEFEQTVDLKAMEKDIEDAANGDGKYLDVRDRISCNHDYDGIAEGYKLLYGKKGTNILICLSDGKPNCDMGCQQNPRYDQSKHDFNKIRTLIHDNERVAKTIGIGVLYDAEQFPTRILVNDLDGLKTGVAAVLKKEIKR